MSRRIADKLQTLSERLTSLEHELQGTTMAKSRTLYRVNRREWLNQDQNDLSAHIIARVGDTTRARSRTTTPDILFKIADCYKQIELEFGMWNDKKRAQSLAKARLLKQVVDEFVGALETEVELVAKRRARSTKKNSQ